MWAVPLGCLGVGTTKFSMQDSCITDIQLRNGCLTEDRSLSPASGSMVNRSHSCPLRFQGAACTCGPSPWGALAWVLQSFRCKTRVLPISNFEMDVGLKIATYRRRVEARSIRPIVAPCAFKGWLARVGPPLGVLGRGCYKVFNARLVSYRYPTSTWMSDCRSQRIAGEWKQGQSAP